MPIHASRSCDLVSVYAVAPQVREEARIAVLDCHAHKFALKHELCQAGNSRNSTVARKREMVHIRRMSLDEENREKRRLALVEFYRHNKPLGLKSVNRWAKTSGVGETTLRQLLDGSRPKNMRADTYEKLAAGASILLGREVNEQELMAESASQNALSERQIRAIIALRALPDDVQDQQISTLESLARHFSGKAGQDSQG